MLQTVDNGIEFFQRVAKQLLASDNNFKFNKFVSRYFWNKALKTDALTFLWYTWRLFPTNLSHQ